MSKANVGHCYNVTVRVSRVFGLWAAALSLKADPEPKMKLKPSRHDSLHGIIVERGPGSGSFKKSKFKFLCRGQLFRLNGLITEKPLE